MNLNTITRKILLAARALHIRSLGRTEKKAAANVIAASRARRLAERAFKAADELETQAYTDEYRVRAAVRAERHELGIDK